MNFKISIQILAIAAATLSGACAQSPDILGVSLRMPVKEARDVLTKYYAGAVISQMEFETAEEKLDAGFAWEIRGKGLREAVVVGQSADGHVKFISRRKMFVDRPSDSGQSHQVNVDLSTIFKKHAKQGKGPAVDPAANVQPSLEVFERTLVGKYGEPGVRDPGYFVWLLDKQFHPVNPDRVPRSCWGIPYQPLAIDNGNDGEKYYMGMPVLPPVQCNAGVWANFAYTSDGGEHIVTEFTVKMFDVPAGWDDEIAARQRKLQRASGKLAK